MHNCRYITRTVLIPFEETPSVGAADHVAADSQLREVMTEEAGKAAGLIVSLGKVLTSQRMCSRIKNIITRVEQLMPRNTPHRLLVSYSWLLGATFAVSYNNSESTN